jgi:hypothetical protein
MERLEIIKLAVDKIKNTEVPTQFSTAQTSEALVSAMIEANGGKKSIDWKTFQRGNELFEIIEEIIPEIVNEGLQGNEFFMNLVDYRNIALGDDIDFWTEDKADFIVADAAYGTQGIRRQRLGKMEKYNVKTQLKVIKVYEELNRLLAGRTNFTTFITKVSKAMTDSVLNDTYTIFDAVTSGTTGLNATYVKSGTYSEDTLLELIEHVEAATGGVATIMGTKAALRKVTTATISDQAKTDMYNGGFYGKFNGTNMIYVPQRHATGTDTFVLNGSKLYIMAGSDKPIKVVNKGEGLMSTNDPLQSADFTQTYLYGQEVGTGLVFNEKAGFYTLS